LAFIKDDAALRAVALPPGSLISTTLPNNTPEFFLARTYNRLGGLMDALAAHTGIELAAALAIWFVESGGQPFIPGRPILRFENHKLFSCWGKNDPARYDAFFQHGGRKGVPGKTFENHKWRRSESAPWTTFHGSQNAEYEVFEFASKLAGREQGCISSSFGGPQILGSNYAMLGYASATELFEAFAESERAHVFGFFDFCAQCKLLEHACNQGWSAFAKGYNGPGNADIYGTRIADAFAAAKRVLRALPKTRPIQPQEEPAAASYFVDPLKAHALNLRKGPAPAATIATLRSRHEVIKISEHPAQPDWWLVSTVVDGRRTEGYVKAAFLTAGAGLVNAVPAESLPQAHLPALGRRTEPGRRAYPLGEASMPVRAGNSPAELSRSVLEIVNFLDPGNPAHLRYAPVERATYCNIYAHDFAMRCQVCLPRVWWTDAALRQIRAGNSVAEDLDITVRELSANAIFDWFVDFGAGFGWRRSLDLTEVQEAANEGKVCFVVAQRANTNDPGHISAVIPEHGGLIATRKNGVVTQPVESQAGPENFRAKVQTKQWWRDTRFRAFAFWIHEA
jgi:hypothetical protein